MELKEILKRIKSELLTLLKVKIEFRHIGSSALGIEGKKDIDLEILVEPNDFVFANKNMISKYGLPKKEIDKFWHKFETKIEEWDIDLFLSISKHPITIRNKVFFQYLKNNLNARNEYLKIKKKSKLFSREQYLKAKEEFLKKIVKKVLSTKN